MIIKTVSLSLHLTLFATQGVSGMSGHGGVGQTLESGYGGGNGGAATAAALSLMHALPLHYLQPGPGADPPHHWDRNHHQTPDKQVILLPLLF